MPNQFSFEGDKEVPPGVRGWNWGAFFLTWIWGICNGTLIALLSLIPGIHFVMMFVLGFKGNEWAWKNKEWESVEQFHAVQRKWAAWAVGLWLIMLGVVLAFIVGILGWGISMEMPEIKSMMRDFAPERKYCNHALSMMEQDPRYQKYIGGKIEVRGPAQARVNESGYIDVAVPVRTPRGEGNLYIQTHQEGQIAAKLERAEIELKNLERMRLDVPKIRDEVHEVENRIVKLVAAKRLRSEWGQRDPHGDEEAEELYRRTLRRIVEDSRVSEILGSQIRTRVEHAQINSEGPGGDAEFVVLADGNDQIATIFIRCTRSLGVWKLSEAKLNSGGRVLQFD